MFNASVWGSVAQWASALLSGSSVTLALYILLRDRRKTETDRVNEVIIQLGLVGDATKTPTEYHVTAQIDNRSKVAIHNCLLQASPKPLPKLLKNPRLAEIYWSQITAGTSMLEDESASSGQKQLKSHLAADPARISLAEDGANASPIDLAYYVEPGTTSVIRLDVPMPFLCYVFYVTFTDYRSKNWQLNMDTMKLRSADRNAFGTFYFNVRKRLGLDGYRLHNTK